MALKYTPLIASFCTAAGIAIPSAFGRHPASHLAIIKLLPDGPRLVAKTFFKHQDVLAYVDRQEATAEPGVALPEYRILDFKDRVELLRAGKTVKPGRSF